MKTLMMMDVAKVHIVALFITFLQVGRRMVHLVVQYIANIKDQSGHRRSQVNSTLTVIATPQRQMNKWTCRYKAYGNEIISGG